MIEFEGLENWELYKQAIKTPEWRKLVSDFKESKYIYFIGNGGLSSNCSHASSDQLRLTDKKVFSLDNMSLFTSLANDFGFSEVFKNFLALQSDREMDKQSMVIAFSGSGNSPNVINCLHWANNNSFKTVLISGQKSELLNVSVNELVLSTDYFHTHEILTTVLFYKMIDAVGASCPTIKNEVTRKNKERNGKK